tara:strand:+ start:549 stop:1178 length:630 start_codon:yes stop_codon:yes gene_type:complete
MGNISVNKLGGISLIVGPVLALIFYLIGPGGSLNGNIDPSDGQAFVSELSSNTAFAVISAILVSMGLITLFHGVSVITKESGDALTGFGLKFILLAVVGWVASQGIFIAIANNSDAGTVYAAAQGVSSISAINASIGFIALSLGLSSRDYINTIFAYIIALVSLVGLIAAVVGALDSSQLQNVGIVAGICYLIWTIWAILIGKDLMARD